MMCSSHNNEFTSFGRNYNFCGSPNGGTRNDLLIFSKHEKVFLLKSLWLDEWYEPTLGKIMLLGLKSSTKDWNQLIKTKIKFQGLKSSPQGLKSSFKDWNPVSRTEVKFQGIKSSPKDINQVLRTQIKSQGLIHSNQVLRIELKS